MTIRPVSDLRNYPKVLEELNKGEPVTLTKNGRSEYVIMSIAEFEQYSEDSASIELLAKLQRSEESLKHSKPIPYFEAIERIKNRYNGN